MEIRITATPEELGRSAARHTAYLLNQAIRERGEARLLLSTGASQFETLQALVQEDVQWGKVTMFHLDEYVDLPETHIASFRKYLKERFISKVPLKAAWLVARMVFRADEPDPVIVEFHSGLKTQFQNVLLANSITLTPGTITVFQEGDHFVIHALRREYAEGLESSSFIKLLDKLK